jgi:hypothetical protein
MRLGSAFLLMLLAARSCGVQAQAARNEVIVVGPEIGQDVFAILQASFAHDGIALTRVRLGGPCEGRLTEPDVATRVWIRWAPLDTGKPLTLCFQDHCRSAERVLGPFARIDARAREEVITVVESSLAALSQGCPAAADDAKARSPGGGGRADPSSLEQTTNVESLAQSSPSALPAPAPAKAPAPRSQPANTETTARVNIDAPVVPKPSSPPLTAAAADRPTTHADGTSLAIGVSYGWTRWTDAVLAQRLSAMGSYAVHRWPIYIGIEVAYVPRFRAVHDALAIDATGVRVGLQLWISIRLSKRWVLDGQLGTAIESLRLTPAAVTARLLSASRSTSHADPLLVMRLGPALRVYSGVLVGIDMQADASWVGRSYGFTDLGVPGGVFTPDRVRLSVALNARAEL